MSLSSNSYYFIHIPKCAGISIAQSLNYSHYGDQHRTAQQICDIVGTEKWASCYSFAIVRNPFDRVVSWFEFHKRSYPNIYGASFRKWVLKGMPTHWDAPVWYMGRWLVVNGARTVETFKLEELSKEWAKIQQRTGVSARLIWTNKSARTTDYRRYYDASSRKVVADICGRDIAEFRYEFGGRPLRVNNISNWLVHWSARIKPTIQR